MGKGQVVRIGDTDFRKKGDAIDFIRAILYKYRPGDRVSDSSDADFLMHLLKRHPEAAQKIGPGVSHFEVRSADFGTRCFWAARTDGTIERFSFKSCV